jgi:hypothetical protein
MVALQAAAAGITFQVTAASKLFLPRQISLREGGNAIEELYTQFLLSVE